MNALFLVAVILVPSVYSWSFGSLFKKFRQDSGSEILGKFFDEAFAENGFNYAYPESSHVSIVAGAAKTGKVAVRFVLAPDDYSGGSICLLNKALDLHPFLKTGALRFWVRGALGNEKAWVALVDEETSDSRKTVARVPIDWFGGIKSDWTLISIPLESFGGQGVYWDAKERREVDNPFDWSKVAEFRMESKKGENTLFDILVDDIYIVKLVR